MNIPLSLLTVAALLTAPLAAASPVLVEGSGSLSMRVQLGNTHVHTSDPTVHALVHLAAEREIRGATIRPINLALVIDRSGSMSGQKIADAREAAIQMVERLRDGDRVAIVSYSDGVRVDAASTVIGGAEKERVKDVIRRIGASGSTHLSGGLVAGHEQVRQHLDSDKVNRVLLISDGLANRGITDLPSLNRLAREASQEGIVTTTLGLGSDYNEDLMTAVADHGGGNYYFVGKSSELAGVLNGELGQMMATVARQATLEITLPDGVEVQEVYGYAWQAEGPTVIVRLGDVFAGQSRNVLWKLRVPAQVGDRALGELALRYQDLVADARRASKATPSVTVTGDGDLVAKSGDKEVAARVAEIELATSMNKAAELMQQGRYEDARKTLRQAADKAKQESRRLGDAGGGLDESAEEAEAMVDDLAAPPASASGQKLMIKRSKAGAYKIKKK